MNSQERVDVSREIYEKGYLSTQAMQSVGYQEIVKLYLNKQISYEEFNSRAKILETRNTDWFDILFRNPFTQSHNVNLSGGTNNTSYYASVGADFQNGTARGNDRKGYKASLNLNTNIKDKVTIGIRLSGSTTTTNGFYRVDPYSFASTTSRVLPYQDDAGDLEYYNTAKGFRYNVTNELNNTGNQNTLTALSLSMNARWKINRWLAFTSTFGDNYTNSYAESYATEYSNYITENFRGYEFGAYGPDAIKYKQSKLPHGGVLNILENRNNNYTWRNDLQYNRTFGKHLVSAMAGQELRSNKYDGIADNRFGYLPGRGKIVVLPPITIDKNGTQGPNDIFNAMTTTVTDRKANYLSYFGNVAYGYDERYVFNASVRSDASNRFGQNRNSMFQPVWSVGGRWNIAREHFFDTNSWMNDLSLRGSFGYQGNVAENVGPDLIAYIPTGSTGMSNLTGEYLLKIKSLPYPDLRWEKNKTINLGLDFGFFQNRVFATLEYYHKRGEDIIINKNVPFENGVLSMPINGGVLVNKGYELTLSFSPVRTKNFLWSVNMNTAKNINKLESTLLPNANWSNAVTGGLYKVGYPVSAFWAFEFLGLDPVNGQPLFNIPSAADKPNGILDATEYMKYMGKMDPDFTSGLNTTFRYKTLTLSSSFYLSAGGKKFLAPAFSSDMIYTTPYEYNNLPKELVNRWRNPGDELLTNIPSLPTSDKTQVSLPNGNSDYPYRLYNYSDIRVVNASFLRCQNISLSYNLSEKQLRRVKAKGMGLGLNVGNPFIIVSKDYKGMDPEVATGSQPITRTYTLSVNMSL